MHVYDVINFMINVILSYLLVIGDVIMNITVSFSLHFAENMLNMS